MHKTFTVVALALSTTGLIAAPNIPGNCEMRFSVVPLDCWGNEGHRISSEWQSA